MKYFHQPQLFQFWDFHSGNCSFHSFITVVLCSLVGGYQRFTETCCFYLQVQSRTVRMWSGYTSKLQGRQSLRSTQERKERVLCSSIRILTPFFATCICNLTTSSPQSVQPWQWKQYVLLQQQYPPTKLRSVKTKNTAVWTSISLAAPPVLPCIHWRTNINQFLVCCAAGLTEPLSCIAHGWDRITPIAVGSRILILGAGIIGNLWASILHLQGHRRVTISEPQEARRKLLEKLGFYDLCWEWFHIHVLVWVISRLHSNG
jgi:hypothetical protein